MCSLNSERSVRREISSRNQSIPFHVTWRDMAWYGVTRPSMFLHSCTFERTPLFLEGHTTSEHDKGARNFQGLLETFQIPASFLPSNKRPTKEIIANPELPLIVTRSPWFITKNVSFIEKRRKIPLIIDLINTEGLIRFLVHRDTILIARFKDEKRKISYC